jgi:undecaprenyl-diphosphatase
LSKACRGPAALLKALILGIVEGVTEFLPVSSTGHLILAATCSISTTSAASCSRSSSSRARCWRSAGSIGRRSLRSLLGLPSDRAAQRFALNVLVAFLPLAIIGLLFGKAIKAYLFNAPVVATAFIVGGLIILWAERREHRIRVESIDDLSLTTPSSSVGAGAGADSGHLALGSDDHRRPVLRLSRRAATEFSFFLAMPTLIGASIYQLYKERALLSFDDLGMWVSVSCRLLSRLSGRCAGCCATSARTTSRFSPGIASLSASSCW